MDRRMFLKATAGLGAGATLGTGLAACGSDSGGSGSLTMSQYGSSSRLDLLEQVFGLYTEANPDRSIGLDAASVDNYIDRLATQVSGGNAPDIMAIFHGNIATFARQDALLTLDDYLGAGLDVSEFTEGIVDLGRIDGSVNALSYGDNAHGVIYDVDRLESLGMQLPEPGYTWEDLLTFSADISRAVDGDFYGTEDRSTQLDQGFKVWLLQRGKYAFTADGQLGFERSDLEDWITYWEMLREEGAAPPSDITAEAGTFESSALIRGYAINHQTYANALNSMQALTESRLALTTLPIDPDGQGSGHFLRGSNWVSVFSETGDPDTAVDFLNFIFNDPGAVGVLGAEFGAPPNRALRDELEYNDAEQNFVDYINLIADELADEAISLDQEFPIGYPDVNTAFGAATESVMFGDSSIDEAVDEFFETAERALES
ncbi:ABC transporter substrate-binding protein [Ruania rhizosphaerae]|uniref:ABC transporter substrate-binding protein n=1 Tax=Ruania rhizosphaerae TaxID=1840413 RepID=UPI0013581C31|nr:ABC transporter substrate-binding protein [Ruania rhizosphaerae]